MDNGAIAGSGEIEPFSNELHERVVKYQDVLFNTRSDNVNKRKDLPVETVAVRLYSFSFLSLFHSANNFVGLMIGIENSRARKFRKIR